MKIEPVGTKHSYRKLSLKFSVNFIESVCSSCPHSAFKNIDEKTDIKIDDVLEAAGGKISTFIGQCG